MKRTRKVRNIPTGGDIYILSRDVPDDDGEPVSVAIYVGPDRTRDYAAQELRRARVSLRKMVAIASGR